MKASIWHRIFVPSHEIAMHFILYVKLHLKFHTIYEIIMHFIQPAREALGPEGLRAESARAVTGRWCPQSGAGEDFLAHGLVFFYGSSRNSETKSQKIVPKVGNEPSLQGLQKDR